MKKPVVLGLVIAALVAVIAGGTWWYQSRQDNSLTLYGNVDIRSVNLSFRVGGRLASLAVDEGDAITAGQVLGKLDRAPYENALMQAKANVAAWQGIAKKRSRKPRRQSNRRRPPMITRRIFTIGR
jgi:HlyD family secretion protein